MVQRCWLLLPLTNVAFFTYRGQQFVVCTKFRYTERNQANRRADTSRMSKFYTLFNDRFVKKQAAQRAALDALAHEPNFDVKRDPQTGASFFKGGSDLI